MHNGLDAPKDSLPDHGRARWVLDLFVLAVAAHSVAAGLCLLCCPMWTLRVVGWQYHGELFWPSQAGLFLILLGIAYGAAIRFEPLLWLLVGSKVCAFVFLMAHTIWLDAPRLAARLGIGDGLMGLCVMAAWWQARREGQRHRQSAH